MYLGFYTCVWRKGPSSCACWKIIIHFYSFVEEQLFAGAETRRSTVTVRRETTTTMATTTTSRATTSAFRLVAFSTTTTTTTAEKRRGRRLSDFYGSGGRRKASQNRRNTNTHHHHRIGRRENGTPSSAAATSSSASLGRSESGETVADAIVVVAGGFTPDNTWLPEWVLERLDYCAEAYKRAEGKPYICIAGSATPHKSPPLQKGGFIYHESTMMAEYLIDEHDVHPAKILKDTSSMDTIGNAYFTRYVHAVPRGWKNVEVVTSKFHMRRVKAAFEWVWGMPLKGDGDTQIRFVSTRDVGLSEETLVAREEREIESERQLRENAKMYDTPGKFAEWMFTTHKCYAVTRQHEIGDFEAVRKELGSNADKLGY